ncbi:MAG TPA: TonB-dependent receptor [Steroidobacteraceae bacterium]|jgi:outer membrane receptor protein involved in Fe transport
MKFSFVASAAGVVLCMPLLGQAATADANASNTRSPAIEDIVVTAQRLDEARNGLSPDTGSTVYKFDTADIANLPLGDSTPLNQVILQAPGVVQDSYGQLHVRGDHANLQYRVNGVVIPESISGFGQSLDTRFVDHFDILTGALPAQYGYRTAGIVDIHSKGTTFDEGGELELTGGSNDHRGISGDISGATGPLSYFLTGSYVSNNLGIENPTPDRDALHDETRQGNGFGYLSYLLGNDSRVSLMFGISDNRFQIPDVPGQQPGFALAGVPDIDSATLDANQREKNRFEVLSYQGKAADDVDYQVSLFHRYTSVQYQPDAIGDLMFNGVAAQILRDDEEVGMQLDTSYRLNDTHTVRAGLFYNQERFNSYNDSSVFAADADGNQLSDVPLSISDDTRLTGHTAGVYLQDEWQPIKSLTINYGARFDKVDTVVDEQQFSPRFGLVYDLTSSTRLHAGYARYFTPPPTEKIDTTSVEKFAGTTNALPSDANTAVSSERSDYFDAGIVQQVTPQMTIGLDAYYRKVKDLQDEGQFGNALIFSAFNYERGRIWGTELSTSYHGQHFSAYANAAYSVAQARNVVTGQFNFDPDELNYIDNNWVYVDHDQRWSGSAGVSSNWQNTTVSADAILGSGLRRGFANSEQMPGYTQVNLALSQHFDLPAFGKLDGRLAMLNVFDNVYELRDGSGIGVGAPQYGTRRALFVSASKTF